MSTLGVAHHKRKTLILDSSEDSDRAARFAARDAAYRAALGLGEGDPLPSSIGSTAGAASRPRGQYTSSAAGGRFRRQLYTL